MWPKKRKKINNKINKYTYAYNSQILSPITSYGSLLNINPSGKCLGSDSWKKHPGGVCYSCSYDFRSTEKYAEKVNKSNLSGFAALTLA